MTEQQTQQDLDQLSINTLRFLAVDQVEKAKNGHPGAPLGCAPIAYLLFHKFMKFDPNDPKWSDRDRFVLSNGHASALLYGALHLTGYDLPMEQLEQFREWGSHTPGHPEYGETPGVEVTTGPLGQGFGEAVGLAIAERHLAAVYNHDNHTPVDHYTYVLCGDGDLMEGISHEASSLAGTLKLGKLIVFYDDNLISLDGPTDLSFTEDVVKRFEAYHWHVQHVDDGNDLEALEKAIQSAKAETTRPSLIKVRTVIGYGSPKAGTKAVHGEALGPEATKETKRNLNWPEDKSFYVPEEAGKNWASAITRGAQRHAEWQKEYEAYAKAYPEKAAEYDRTTSMKLAEGWEKSLPVFPTEKPIATRNAGQQVMNAIAEVVPELFGGAADLTSSTKTIFAKSENFHLDPAGRNVFFWCARVRHDGGGEWDRGAWWADSVRLDILYVLGLLPVGDPNGCAPVEPLAVHLYARLDRSWRRWPDTPAGGAPDGAARDSAADGLPAGGRERDGGVLEAGARAALGGVHGAEPAGPAVLDAEKYKIAEGVPKGAYALDSTGKDIILIATGSEVSLILKAAEELKKDGIHATVVSMPSFKIFDEQEQSYRDELFPEGTPKLAVEAGATMGWWKYVGHNGGIIGVDRFGASAPGPIVLEKFGFTVANVVDQAKKLVKK